MSTRLVDYGDESEEEELSDTKAPPLPESFYDLYTGTFDLCAKGWH